MLLLKGAKTLFMFKQISATKVCTCAGSKRGAGRGIAVNITIKPMLTDELPQDWRDRLQPFYQSKRNRYGQACFASD